MSDFSKAFAHLFVKQDHAFELVAVYNDLDDSPEHTPALAVYTQSQYMPKGVWTLSFCHSVQRTETVRAQSLSDYSDPQVSQLERHEAGPFVVTADGSGAFARIKDVEFEIDGVGNVTSPGIEEQRESARDHERAQAASGDIDPEAGGYGDMIDFLDKD